MRVNWIRDPHRGIPILNFYLYFFATHTRTANPSKPNKNIGSIRCWSTQVCGAFCSGGFWFWLWQNDKGELSFWYFIMSSNMDGNSIWNVPGSKFEVFVCQNQPEDCVRSLMHADYVLKLWENIGRFVEYARMVSAIIFLCSINSRLINDAIIDFMMREDASYMFLFLNRRCFGLNFTCVINYTIVIALLKLYYSSCYPVDFLLTNRIFGNIQLIPMWENI